VPELRFGRLHERRLLALDFDTRPARDGAELHSVRLVPTLAGELALGTHTAPAGEADRGRLRTDKPVVPACTDAR
jgi:hypothetical protein